MRKLSVNESAENINSVRRYNSGAQHVAVFSFTGADPVSFGVCARSRA